MFDHSRNTANARPASAINTLAKYLKIEINAKGSHSLLTQCKIDTKSFEKTKWKSRIFKPTGFSVHKIHLLGIKFF